MPLELRSSLPGHRASHTLRRSILLHRRIGLLLDDGLRDLGVRMTALVQRGACECSDACRCCQLPATALGAASRYSHQPFLLFYFYIYTYIYITYTFSDSCFTAGLYIICMHNMFNMYIYTYTYIYTYIYIHILLIYVYIYIHVYVYMI
jgi:hypothetical protein